mgnify:CR=1 FL=1
MKDRIMEWLEDNWLYLAVGLSVAIAAHHWLT